MARTAQTSFDVGGMPPLTTDGLQACFPETLAYFEVVMLARQFGDHSDVFDDSLEQLRADLSDCLEDASAPPSLNAVYKRRPHP